MFTRISSLLTATLLLSACGPGSRNSAPKAENLIDCMVDGADAFTRVCAVERGVAENGVLMLIIRHPSGGFRRMAVPKDGGGVGAADGAEQVVITPVDEQRVEVTLGGDRYRLPVTMKP